MFLWFFKLLRAESVLLYIFCSDRSSSALLARSNSADFFDKRTHRI